MITSHRNQPLISVIIPTCERPLLLKGAIESALKQTLKDIEIIVVDDDPLMSARLSVESFDDPRLFYYTQDKRRGGSAARNTGLGKARAEYVAFLDDDDTWRPDFLETLFKEICRQAQDVGVVSCAVEFVEASGQRRKSRTHPNANGYIFDAVLSGERSIVGTVALVRREVFKVSGGFDEQLPSAQDWDMWIRAARHFKFVHLNTVLADVRDFGARISSDPWRPVRSREYILNKYADDFLQHPKARVILLKRLVKLHVLLGNYRGAWRWALLAGQGRPIEWLKMAAWMILERPLAVRHGEDPKGPLYGAALFFLSLGVVAYAQLSVWRFAFVVNDDVCQHIWWMRAWQDPALFRNDFLRQYAESLQPVGVWLLYRLGSLVLDPLSLAKFLPLILFPAAAIALYRWIFFWIKDAFAAFAVALAFMVTPIYMQHTVGGHAHTFGYLLLILFLNAISREHYRQAAGWMIFSVLFFPVIFALSGGYWIYSFCRRKKNGVVWQGPVVGEKMLGVSLVLGLLVLSGKFFFLSPKEVGHVFNAQAIMHMPELQGNGRWAIWPVMPVWQAFVEFMERGLFLYKAGYRMLLSPELKTFLLTKHVLWLLLTGISGVWWWRHRERFSFKPLGVLLAVSALFYVCAAMMMLKLYAPDRYVSYTVSLVGLVLVMVPLAVTVSGWPHLFVRQILKVALVVLVVAWVPLVKAAGLTDYGRLKPFYSFLSTLPKDSLIAAFPDTADAVPLFARRSVLVSFELSVPLYDAYWSIVSNRTKDFLLAYYAPDEALARLWLEKYGVTHLVIEKHRFSSEYLEGRVYVEPFNAWIKSRIKPGQDFAWLHVDALRCVYQDEDRCVIDL